MKYFFKLMLLVSILSIIILYQVMINYSFESKDYNSHSCFESKEEQFFQDSIITVSYFIENMKLIQNQRLKQGLNATYSVSYMRFNTDANQVISLIPLIFKSNSEFFTFVENGEIYPPYGLRIGRLRSLGGIITWRFTTDKEDKNTLDYLKKSDTELMCRNIGNNSMTCPETYIITPDINELDIFLSKYKNNEYSWIIKTDGTFSGRGATLSSNPYEIKRIADDLLETTKKSSTGEYIGGIIQRIIDNPFLYKNRRFSFRMWTAVTSLNPFKLYYSKAYVMLLAGIYTNDNSKKDEILSNFGYQPWNNRRTSIVFLEYLKENNLLTKWIEYSLPLIKNGFYQVLSQMTAIEPQVKTFELLGCDVILDNNLTPYFLECNPSCGGSGPYEYIILEELVYIALFEQLNNNETPNNLQIWEEIYLTN